MKDFVHILFPDFCCVCDRYGHQVCRGCIPTLPLSKGSESIHIISPLSYRDARVRELLKSLKTRKDIELANTLGEYLYTSSQDLLSELTLTKNLRSSIIIPIPITKDRMHTRGFNQAELLAHAFAESYNRHSQTNNKVLFRSDVLIKTKDTEKQATVESREKRFINIQNSFAIHQQYEDLISGQYIILIDDITTTGATLLAARKTLLDAGAREVLCLAVAH